MSFACAHPSCRQNRLLGGLLSSYQLTDGARLLDLAEELGAPAAYPVLRMPAAMPIKVTLTA